MQVYIALFGTVEYQFVVAVQASPAGICHLKHIEAKKVTLLCATFLEINIHGCIND